MPKTAKRKGDIKIRNRREQVIKLLLDGSTRGQIAGKLGVSYKTVQNDVDAVGKELCDEVKRKPLQNALSHFLMVYDELYRNAMKVYRKAKRPAEQVGALKIIQGIMSERVKILQSLGIVKETPKKLELGGDDKRPIVVTWKKPSEISK